ncbi:MAG: hypothetical protein LPK19_08350, partial [Hymenobacteraceae bacterium]|nr:hypothetical protein [Hymenobacteraceae bacterium]MDX5396225.1 hypothetical protein [Hymenobacteraceae bacterium]MDX5512288.1 hypothetical protein [Hymenobacteraceae bacterium]
MKFREIFRYQFLYQLNRPLTWVYFVVLVGLTVAVLAGFIDDAQRGAFFFNAPVVIAGGTVIMCMLSLLVTAGIAGSVATLDLEDQVEPLLFTTPVNKFTYLGARFFAAFAICCLLMTAIPAGIALTMCLSNIHPELLGPLRLNAYITSFFLFVVPHIFVVTAVQFSFALLSRHALGSYAAGAVLFLIIVFSKEYLAVIMGEWELAKLLDVSGFTVVSEWWRTWLPAEKNTNSVSADKALLLNRLLWLSVATVILTIAYVRFWFAYYAPANFVQRKWQLFTSFVFNSGKSIGFAKSNRKTTTKAAWPLTEKASGLTGVFNFQTHQYQLLETAWSSFFMILKSRIVFVLPVALALLVHVGLELMEGELGTPITPVTSLIIRLYNQHPVQVIIVTLISLFTGKLIWRERSAGINEIADAMPVPDVVLFLGKFLGVVLMLVTLQAICMAAGITIQMVQNYYQFEPGLYLQILFGFQLLDYVMLAVLAMLVHVLVNQQYLGHVLVLLLYL